MYNPMEEAIPSDAMARIRAFVKDLAFGAANGMWSPEIRVNRSVRGGDWSYTAGRDFPKLLEKWDDQIPYVGLLVSFEYLDVVAQEQYGNLYTLTPKAFALLEQASPASIFISYSRAESSAFALLLLARLKAVGLDPFLDLKDLNPGDEWEDRLRNEVASRQHFICLIGPRTLESDYVQQEIAWAMDAGTRTIPIWHNGFVYNDGDSEDETLRRFLRSNAIVVERENAKAYEGAILELLNYFGFTP